MAELNRSPAANSEAQNIHHPPIGARSIIERALSSGKKALLEYEAEDLARRYKIPVASSGLAKTEKEAASLSRRLGYPVVMKIVSPDILHKTDVGGVKVNIGSDREARETFRTILRNAKRARKGADLIGVLVQKMAQRSSNEFVVGATRDPQFGPTVMFGLGGIYIEIFKDVSFRLAPVSETDSMKMMREIKSSALLTGFRGSKPLDMVSASRVIRAVGEIMLDFDSIDSIDINPLFIYPRGVLAPDVRILLKGGNR